MRDSILLLFTHVCVRLATALVRLEDMTPSKIQIAQRHHDLTRRPPVTHDRFFAASKAERNNGLSVASLVSVGCKRRGVPGVCVPTTVISRPARPLRQQKGNNCYSLRAQHGDRDVKN
jgi:hypothetical protein